MFLLENVIVIPCTTSLNREHLFHGYPLQFQNLSSFPSCMCLPSLFLALWLWYFVIKEFAPFRYTLRLSKIIALLHSSKVRQTMAWYGAPSGLRLLPTNSMCLTWHYFMYRKLSSKLWCSQPEKVHSLIPLLAPL